MHQLQCFWSLIRPFWTRSERRVAAWALLALVMALSLSTVWFSVRLNTWNGAFFNAIQAMDGDKIYPLLLEFIAIVSVFVVVLVYADWFQKKLIIEWREWMTADLLSRWLSKDSHHYRLKLAGLEPDNPDQRIQEDVRLLVESSLSLLISFARSLLTIVSFITILWTLSGTLSWVAFGVEWTIPGYMLWACIGYTLVATGLTHLIGRPLMALNFEQQKREADFRSGLFGVRQHGEAVAGFHGEANESQRLQARFKGVVSNWRALMDRQRNLAFFTVGFGQVTQLVPIFFALPQFLSGAIQLGGLMQVRLAFGQVASAIGWFIYAYRDIAEWSATVDRLMGFERALATPLPQATFENPRQSRAISVAGALQTPKGEVLLKDVAFSANPGELTVIKGASGIGKSTLMRALAGFWPWVDGRIATDRSALWISQATWLPQMTLPSLLAYPNQPEAYTHEQYVEALEAVGLAALKDDLDCSTPILWSQRCSGGEQQRLLIARALLQKPDVLLMDETTSGLDDALVERLLHRLKITLTHSTMVLISHQPTAHRLADRLVHLGVQS